jgi:hypothetical protein
MPYEKMNVTVRCDEIACKYNEDEKCKCDEEAEALDPDCRNQCFMYSSYFENGAQLKFDTLEELSQFVKEHEGIAPLVVYDDRALNLLFTSTRCLLKNSIHDHVALVQIAREDVENVMIRPSVDGALLVVPKIQMEMPSLLCA